MPKDFESKNLLEAVKAGRSEILGFAEKRLYARQGGRSIVKYLSQAVDEFISEFWQHVAGNTGTNVDIVAVGGYGRAELCPYSDWDILFLVPEGKNLALNESIRIFTQLLWDSGTQLGHAVRTPKQTKAFAASNHHAQTALMESRLVSGSGRLYRQLNTSINPQYWNKKRRLAFCIEKIEECKVRRQAQGGTAFVMEPDCKNGQGGLRDVSTIFWLAMAWYGVATARELTNKGPVDEKEFEGFVGGREFLWRVRSGLHFLSGRENDRLVFGYQTELASRFRYRDTSKSSAVERFLKNYFLNVRRIDDLSSLFLQHFEEEIRPPSRFSRRKLLTGGMQVKEKKVGILNEQEFLLDPLNLLRIFSEGQVGDRRIDSAALRVVRKNSRSINATVRASKEANNIFLEILRANRNVTTALSEMHETGVLGQFCPDFKRITGHGQFDRYHHYTVDAHTIRAIDILRDFRVERGQFVDMPLASTLMSQLERPELIYIAVLFHDIAKGRGGDHSVLGETLVKKFCSRLGLSKDDAEIVGWLVLHHLALSKTAQHYDLSDAKVIADFANFVGDRERLVYLFVMTVADVAAVGPGTWTEWKGHLFSQLFHQTEAHLRLEQGSPEDLDHRVDTRRASVLKGLTGSDKKSVGRVLDIITNTMVMRFTPNALLSLCRLLRKESGVHFVVNKSGGYTQVLTWGVDREKLFFDLTMSLAIGSTKVLTAHAYGLRDRRVLDEFHITNAKNLPIVEAGQLQRLSERLLKVHSGELESEANWNLKYDVLMKAIPVNVRHHEAASDAHTAIEVIAADRKGLLCTLAKVISEAGVNLQGANVSTFGEKAIDVFFVTDNRGRKLNQKTLRKLIAQLADAAQLPEASDVA
ncbi:MAG: [protein-PII] uridylyltransferase [Gammaproteobacteria bacterium]